MTKKLFYILIALLLFSSLVLGACATTPEPTEEVVVEDPVEEPAVFEAASFSAESCDYGGKVLSVTALDEYTVEFTLCKSDPAFIAKIHTKMSDCSTSDKQVSRGVSLRAPNFSIPRTITSYFPRVSQSCRL